MMNNWIKAGIAAVGVAVFATAAFGQDKEPIRWRLSSYNSETSGLYRNIVVPFTERVNQLAAGRLIIEPYPVDVLAPATRNHEAVLDGTADAAMVTPLYVVNQDPANAFYAGHPGGMGPETLIYWLYEGGGQELLTEFKRETMGLHALVGGVVGTELWHSRTPINSIQDLEGKKFRAAGSWASILADELKAAPVFVTGGEVYQMLERGGVDVAEWSGPADNMASGLQNAARYVIYPGIHFPAGINEFIVKAEKWDALPDDLKDVVTTAAKLAVFESYLQSGKEDIDAMEKLRAGNNEFIELNAETLQGITAAGRKWADQQAEKQTAAGNPWMKRIGDSYYNFQELYAKGGSFKHVDRQ